MDPLKQVFDEDIGQDKRLGIVKLPLIELEAETSKEYELRLLSSLDTLKVKDKKDRGTILLKVFVNSHLFISYCYCVSIANLIFHTFLPHNVVVCKFWQTHFMK